MCVHSVVIKILRQHTCSHFGKKALSSMLANCAGETMSLQAKTHLKGSGWIKTYCGLRTWSHDMHHMLQHSRMSWLLGLITMSCRQYES